MSKNDVTIELKPGPDGIYVPKGDGVADKQGKTKRQRVHRKPPPRQERPHAQTQQTAAPAPSNPMNDIIQGVQIGLGIFNQLRRVLR